MIWFDDSIYLGPLELSQELGGGHQALTHIAQVISHVPWVCLSHCSQNWWISALRCCSKVFALHSLVHCLQLFKGSRLVHSTMKVWIVGSAKHAAMMLNRNAVYVKSNPVVHKTEVMTSNPVVPKTKVMKSPSPCRVTKRAMKSPSPSRVISFGFSPPFTRAARFEWVGTSKFDAKTRGHLGFTGSLRY